MSEFDLQDGRDRAPVALFWGFEPVSAGSLDNARLLEDHLAFMSVVSQGLGRFFYRYAKPGEL